MREAEPHPAGERPGVRAPEGDPGGQVVVVKGAHCGDEIGSVLQSLPR